LTSKSSGDATQEARRQANRPFGPQTSAHLSHMLMSHMLTAAFGDIIVQSAEGIAE